MHFVCHVSDGNGVAVPVQHTKVWMSCRIIGIRRQYCSWHKIFHIKLVRSGVWNVLYSIETYKFWNYVLVQPVPSLCRRRRRRPIQDSDIRLLMKGNRISVKKFSIRLSSSACLRWKGSISIGGASTTSTCIIEHVFTDMQTAKSLQLAVSVMQWTMYTNCQWRTTWMKLISTSIYSGHIGLTWQIVQRPRGVDACSTIMTSQVTLQHSIMAYDFELSFRPHWSDAAREYDAYALTDCEYSKVRYYLMGE